MYAGNYDFWYESSQLMQQLIRNQNKKKEEKIKELQSFIQRFSANKSKSKQATSRKKILDSIQLEEMPASSRRYPFVGFDPEREAGKDILFVQGLTKTVDGVKVLDNVTFTMNKKMCIRDRLPVLRAERRKRLRADPLHHPRPDQKEGCRDRRRRSRHGGRPCGCRQGP